MFFLSNQEEMRTSHTLIVPTNNIIFSICSFREKTRIANGSKFFAVSNQNQIFLTGPHKHHLYLVTHQMDLYFQRRIFSMFQPNTPTTFASNLSISFRGKDPNANY